MLAAAIFAAFLSLVAGQIYYCGFETDVCSGLDISKSSFTNAETWVRLDRKTPQALSGPTTAASGSFFIYFASAVPNNRESTNLPLNLTLSSSVTSLRLKFALHAYGNGIKSFNVRFIGSNMMILLDDQILTGQIQTSTNDPWTVIDKPYTFSSPVMRIQFVVTTIDLNFNANVAIDELYVLAEGSGSDPCSSCSLNAVCVTTNGVKQCVCNNGFIGNGNTCSVDPCSSCSVNAQCVTTNGVRQCACNNGFIGNGNTCSVDPCSSCSVNAQCVTTNGVRQCACNNGFIGNGNTCSASVNPCSSCNSFAQCVTINNVQQCQCLSGYIGDGLTCILNQCTGCSANAQCVVGNGVQQCVCNSGFTGDGRTCTATSVCSTCSANAQCVTINNVQQCVCSINYIGDGRTCTFGCGVAGRTCGANAQCLSVNNVQQCSCLNGYGGDGITCTPSSNLCGSVLCSPYADCVTEFGLPVCRCRPGYVCGSQCVTQGICSNFATCSVVNGLETCTCAPEYSGDGFSAPGSTGCRSKCDIAACPLYSSCTLNSAFVASCQCNPNFVWSNGACVDVNECLTVGWCRGANTYCLNSIGGFSCECQPNYLVNASTSGRDRSCPSFQTCSIGKTCNCPTFLNPNSVPSITFFAGVNEANPTTALQYLNIWSDANVKAYCKATGCDQSMLGDIVSNITVYVRRAEEMMNNSMVAMQKVREYIDCNSFEALEPAWWNLYDTLSSQFIIFKQVRRDLGMKLTFMMEESKRCEQTNADWFRKYLEWLSPVKF